MYHIGYHADGRRKLLNRGRLLRCALGQRLRSCGNLVGASRYLVGRGAYLCHCRAKLVVDIADIVQQLLAVADIVFLVLCGMDVQVARGHRLEYAPDIADDVVEVRNHRLGSLGKHSGFVLEMDLGYRACEVALCELLDTLGAYFHGAAYPLADTDRNEY